tara:strand:- start:3586 stop:3819 length:234 start_codon:yes stop_codon:yes gene_type:complete
MKIFFFLTFGILIGSWISWPGILFPENWECFNQVIEDSKKEKISIKTILTFSPQYILNGIPADNISRLRIVSDVCFR